MTTAWPYGIYCPQSLPSGGNAGYTVALTVGWIDDNLSSIVKEPQAVLCNLGSNDVYNGDIVEATWKTNYEYIVDAILTQWPSVTVYIAKSWRRGYTADCNTIAGWIDDIILDYPGGNVLVGHDERTWLEGGDDGATMTSDGIHYSEAGQTECAAQWEAILAP